MNQVKIRTINPAEAIFAPFFDKNLTSLEDLIFSESEKKNGKVYRNWDTYGASSDSESFSLKWRGHIELEQYDKIVVFINFTENITMNGYCDIEGQRVTLFEGIKSYGEPVEVMSPSIKKAGEHKVVENLTLEFKRAGELTGKILLSWFGLLSSEREHLIEEELPNYDSNWEGLLNPKGKSGVVNSVFGSQEHLEKLKKKITNSKFIDIFKKREQELLNDLSYVPEEEIRAYLPAEKHLYRFVRVRDRGRKTWDDLIMDLAVVGYILEREEFSKLAARLILCCVHTPYWFEGPIQHMEDSTFHHVCFMEDHYVRSIVSAIGFLGDYFTDKAKELIVKKIKENWEWVDLKCSEPGYRQFMNQGIVGNCGRMMGAYYLYLNNQGSRERVEKCYSEHTLTVNNCLNEEGHYTEGAQYYHYSFASSLLLWFLYANYKACNIKEVLPERFKRSKNYVEALLSTSSQVGLVIPISAGTGTEYSLLMMAVLGYCCDYERGKKVLQNKLDNFKISAHASMLDVILLYSIVDVDCIEPQSVELQKEELMVFPEGGLLSYEFKEGKVILLCERNPLTGHHHKDRGGIILEYDKKMILPDIGTTNYSNTNSGYMGQKEYHNICYPMHGEMTVASPFAISRANMAAYPIDEQLTERELYTPEAKLVSYSNTKNKLSAIMDVTCLYGSAVKKGTRDITLFREEEGLNLFIEDEYQFDQNQLPEGDKLCVNYLSYGKWECSGSMATAMIDKVKVSVSFMTKYNTPLQLSVDDAMTDYKNDRVFVLRCKTEQTTCEIIRTTIRIEKV